MKDMEPEASEDKLFRVLTRISYDEMCERMQERIEYIEACYLRKSEDAKLRYEYYGWTQEDVNEYLRADRR